MDHPRPCGCKGRRTCLSCEKDFDIDRIDYSQIFQKLKAYTFCPHCNRIYPGWDTDTVMADHERSHNGDEGEEYSGIYIELDFITADEENRLMRGIDEMPWDISQSGRRKQNFGPKTNFKKTKIKPGDFAGFPQFSEFVQTKFNDVPLMKGFQTIEQCSLEYTPERGASIDPHIDDCWIWGERVVTVNLLSDSVLTMSRFRRNGEKNRYNLHFVDKYKDELIMNLPNEEELDRFDERIVRIPMPRRSLLVMYGSPRYQWEHAVLREDIRERRVCLAYREFTPMYIKGGSEYSKSQQVFQLAQNFWNHSEVNPHNLTSF
ncbi:alpha-ketoglutarate-dependent dioxygenase alkB homolog 4 isoform X1 [Wyeomyia smithii]|uniref:alpha-ketoglutarate-dependent dioxygenase alkB homolog 4 isoform X1 n=1 Tax=Wyeomyia smithii TaxID=174621 RepID=UPI002467FE4C|nr:alpha-ketoglutarate-dependent dioxygenase alkB homolog 4 isoform X1 [Wyeomyia smithii]